MAERISKKDAILIFRKINPEYHWKSYALHFANINERKEVWWYDIPVEKVADKKSVYLDLLAYDYRIGKLHHLQVPIEWLNSNLSNLAIREEKGTISLELSASNTNLFQDIRPTSRRIHFSQFEIKK